MHETIDRGIFFVTRDLDISDLFPMPREDQQLNIEEVFRRHRFENTRIAIRYLRVLLCDPID